MALPLREKVKCPRTGSAFVARAESDKGNEMASSSISVGKTIPAGIWVLGFVSLLMDVSSEMIHALLPIYLVTILGTSALTVGVIEGIAEATASITKIFSGALSDWLGKRKFLAAFGYGLAAFTKPIFPLATTRSAGWSPRASSIASARASAAPRAMRSSPTSPRRSCAGRASASASRSTRSALSSGRSLRSS